MNKFISKSILFLAILLFPLFSMAQVWQGQAYDTKQAPPDEVLNEVKVKIVAQGISENYFNNHFKLVYASISNASESWGEIETHWNYRVNEYAVNYWVMVNRFKEVPSTTGGKSTRIIGNDLSFLMPTDNLHEIIKTISRTQADQAIKNCLSGGEAPVVTIDRSGNLFLSGEGEKDSQSYRANVNLETGAATCEPIIYTYTTQANKGPGQTVEIPEKDPFYIFKTYKIPILFGGGILIVLLIWLISRKRARIN
jgi:hypothetical protein